MKVAYVTLVTTVALMLPSILGSAQIPSTLVVTAFEVSQSGRGDAVVGAIVRINERIVGETGQDGTLTTTVAGGTSVLVEAFVPCFLIGQRLVNLPEGDTVEVEIILDEKEFSENSTLRLLEMESGRFPATAESFTLQFARDGSFIPVSVLENADLEPTATKDGMALDRIIQVAADGSLVAADLGLLRTAIGGRSEVRIDIFALDFLGLCHSDVVSFSMPDTPGNSAPVADAGPDQDIECDSANAFVLLDGSASSDDDGDALSYQWLSANAEILGLGESLELSLGVGAHPFRLAASDGNGGADTDTVLVIVRDSVAPTVESLHASPDSLWPPNHEMVAVTISASVSDSCDPTPVCRITSVTSNEPIDGTDGGDTAPDWEILGFLEMTLRSERAGRGSGRIYTIGVTCADAAGNETTSHVAVAVPHDRRRTRPRGSSLPVKEKRIVPVHRQSVPSQRP